MPDINMLHELPDWSDDSRTEIRAFDSLQASISPHPMPALEMCVADMTVHALIDTGARCTLLSGTLYDYLEAKRDEFPDVIVEPLTKLPGTLVTANNGHLHIMGQCVLNVALTDGMHVQIWFAVVEGLMSEMLIGDHTLGPERLQAVINLGEWTIYLAKLDLSLPLLRTDQREFRAATKACRKRMQHTLRETQCESGRMGTAIRQLPVHVPRLAVANAREAPPRPASKHRKKRAASDVSSVNVVAEGTRGSEEFNLGTIERHDGGFCYRLCPKRNRR